MTRILAAAFAAFVLLSGSSCGTMPHRNTTNTQYEIDARLLEKCDKRLPELESRELTDVLITLDKGAARYDACAGKQDKLSDWVCTNILKTEECAK